MLELSNNFSNYKWAAGFFIYITLSFILLNKAIQSIPLGTAYALWKGIEAVGIVAGIFFSKKPINFWK